MVRTPGGERGRERPAGCSGESGSRPSGPAIPPPAAENRVIRLTMGNRRRSVPRWLSCCCPAVSAARRLPVPPPLVWWCWHLCVAAQLIVWSVGGGGGGSEGGGQGRTHEADLISRLQGDSSTTNQTRLTHHTAPATWNRRAQLLQPQNGEQSCFTDLSINQPLTSAH